MPGLWLGPTKVTTAREGFHQEIPGHCGMVDVDVVPTCTDHLDPFGSMEVCMDSDIKGILKSTCSDLSLISPYCR